MSSVNNKLKIPPSVKVGFQNRTDTYSGKLAFVVSVDKNGKSGGGKSWENWRDEKIDPVTYTNEPTSGFVLNRDVGGTQRSYSWNARREKVRVYDPRGYEFEINVENLLFVLQECSSIKGKGLEGEFVYAWSGSQIILLPVSSQEYKNSTDFCNLQEQKVLAKDIIAGHTYLTKDQKEVMYLGKHPWGERKYKSKKVEKLNTSYYRNYYERVWWYETKYENKHIFVVLNSKNTDRNAYFVVSGFTKIAKKVNDQISSQYAEEYDKLQKTGYTSKPSKIVIDDKPLDKINFGSNNNRYGYYNGIRGIGLVKDNCVYIGHVRAYLYQNSSYTIDCRTQLSIRDGVVFEEYVSEQNKHLYKDNMSKEEVINTVRKVFIECENGSRYQVEG